MDNSQKKLFGIISLVICAICFFVAIERYSTNANNVQAMNHFTQSSPLSSMMGGGQMKAATPAASKYAIVFALISGISGFVLISQSGKKA